MTSPHQVPPAPLPDARSPYGQPVLPPPRAGVNGLAIASLITGILALIPVSAILGVIALFKVSRHRQRGKGLAITGLVFSGVWLLVFVGLFAYAIAKTGKYRDADGRINRPAVVDIEDLRVGDCARELDADKPAGYVWGVPCADPHMGEVFGIVQLTGDAYPTEDAMDTQAEQKCAAELARYAPKLDFDDVRFLYSYPLEDDWERGDREVACFAYSASQRTGSIRD